MTGPSAQSYVADPLHIDARGATARTDYAGWIRDQIWAVLFTAPAERVHRPDFGSGVPQLLFAPSSGELAATVRLLVQGALQQWMGHLIEVEGIDVATEDTTITVTVAYLIRGTGDRKVDEFSSAGAQ
ncbi:phage baseplate assembly protein W (plasmid) [Mycobacterium sp. JS623]|uniref:GPW/gp25 family protein n=1 Tax=Mycobacterium sp. JS623 TaxID=212767 RepID=UPI0002A5A9A8|nr:GPW/gp25 family protein [Mycobacterium sp. JS623]AGB26693.1 phage baseplate assembly protein W [Mycobacterium sp. JS623]